MAFPGKDVLRKLLPILCLALAACGGEQASVTLGAAGPWDATFGLMNRRGIELAIEELNARYPDRQFTVDFQNDSGSGTRAAQVAQQFVDDPRIVGVVGHVNSGAMVAAAKVYDGHLPAIATTASSPDLSGISPWAFRVISSDSANGIEIARWAARKAITRAAILYENNSYGRGLADAFRTAFRGEVVSMDPIAETAEQDLEPHIAFLRQAAPQLVFVAGTEASGLAFMRAARRQGLQGLFVGGDGWSSLVSDPVAAEGAYVGAPFSAGDPRPRAREFVAAFSKKFGMEPDGNAALAYDATMIIAEAVREAGADRKKVQGYLRNLRNGRHFEGVTGTIAFTESGDAQDKQIVMTRIAGGRLLVEGR